MFSKDLRQNKFIKMLIMLGIIFFLYLFKDTLKFVKTEENKNELINVEQKTTDPSTLMQK